MGPGMMVLRLGVADASAQEPKFRMLAGAIAGRDLRRDGRRRAVQRSDRHRRRWFGHALRRRFPELPHPQGHSRRRGDHVRGRLDPNGGQPVRERQRVSRCRAIQRSVGSRRRQRGQRVCRRYLQSHDPEDHGRRRREHVGGPGGKLGSTDGTGSAARFNSPRGIAVDSAGTVYVADTNNHTIRQITPAGVVTTLAGLPGSSGTADGTGTAARFNQPRGIAVDRHGYPVCGG